MLNSSVPFLCSLIIALALPSAAHSGLPAFGETKVVATATSSTTQKTVSFALPGQEQMSYVHAYIRENDDALLAVRKRSNRYFKIIESVFQKFGLPAELKYLPVIESD